MQVEIPQAPATTANSDAPIAQSTWDNQHKKVDQMTNWVFPMGFKAKKDREMTFSMFLAAKKTKVILKKVGLEQN